MDEDAPFAMRWPRVCARVAGYAVLAVVFYVLSIGPAYYLILNRSPALNRAVMRFYAPLNLLAERTVLLVTYMSWWSGLPGGPDERYLRQSPPLPAVNDPGPAEPIP